MNRGLRRPLIALVVTVVVVGAWVGAPLMAAPADPLGLMAVLGPDQREEIQLRRLELGDGHEGEPVA